MGMIFAFLALLVPAPTPCVAIHLDRPEVRGKCLPPEKFEPVPPYQPAPWEQTKDHKRLA